jgi:hypothetical protein
VNQCQSRAQTLVADLLEADSDFIDSVRKGQERANRPSEELHRLDADDCIDVGWKIAFSGKELSPEFYNILHARRVDTALTDAYNDAFPSSFSTDDAPTCKKLLDSGILDKARSFVDTSSRDTSSLEPKDVWPFYEANSDIVKCGHEARKKGWFHLAARLYLLQGQVTLLTLAAQLNSEARLIRSFSPSVPGQPVKIQIQVLPSPGRRLPPPQTCSGTVFGEGSLQMINWECF